jgi:hypothetical protein
MRINIQNEDSTKSLLYVCLLVLIGLYKDPVYALFGGWNGNISQDIIWKSQE